MFIIAYYKNSLSSYSAINKLIVIFIFVYKPHSKIRLLNKNESTIEKDLYYIICNTSIRFLLNYLLILKHNFS